MDSGAHPLAADEAPLPPPREGRRGPLRVFVAIVIAALVLTWLFLQADAVTTREHEDYQRQLRELRQSDAELDAALLASRFGLEPDFDAIVTHLEQLRRHLLAAGHIPGFVQPADRGELATKLATLARLHEDKAGLVDRFKRDSSLLRNSLAYFPVAAERLLNAQDTAPALQAQAGRYARGVMTHAQTGDARLGIELAARHAALERLAADAREPTVGTLETLLRHGAVIVERKPILDALTRELRQLATTAHLEALSQAYARAHHRATRLAHTFRWLLYVTALALAGYLAVAMLHLGRASIALRRANHDLEQRLGTLQRTRDELRLFASVFTNASEGMIITEADARIVAVNPAFSAITGFTAAEAIGHTPALLCSGRHDGSFYREMWQALQDEGHWRGEIWDRRRDGSVFPEWLSISPLNDNRGAVSHYIGVFSDISERKDAEARIRHMVHHDALTGLPNRVLLQDRLEQAILTARRQERLTAVLFMDLDRFKNINDTLGHDSGDALLTQVADRCHAALREIDTVSRQGGDEFVVVLPDLAHAQDVGMVARKLLAALELPFRLGPHALSVTASIGIALYPDDGQTASELMRNADAAMYRAKADGRARYQFYAADMNSSLLGELLLETQLRGAIERNELRLYYQPKVDAATGRLSGMEALLRWDHPELGLLSPARFITVAEDSGLIVPIGEWVLRTACRQMRSWLDDGLDPAPVSVNLSAHQFGHQDIVARVDAVLTENDLDAGRLELELTETALMRDMHRALEVLERLRNRGVGLSIDDFGSGYSSLGYLHMFPVQVLKIDQTFVHGIRPGGTDGKIATAIIALGHSLGLQVIAEGVETEYQRVFLAGQACNHLQGYLFGRPMSGEAIAERLPRRLPIA